MSTIVKHFCDRCKEHKSDTELVEITISMRHLGNGVKITPTWTSGLRVDWCHSCCKTMGMDTTQTIVDAPPTPTIEEMFRDIVREEVDAAMADNKP